MAAYAALVSVMHIIDQLQLHPRPPISLHNQQARSLTRNISFLQDFLEGYNSHVGYSDEADELESRIADAAYAAEDVIESHIVDRILAGSRSSSHGEEIFYQNLEKVIERMDLIEKEVMKIEDQLQTLSLAIAPAGSSRSTATGRNVTMVGVDEILIKLLDMLTSNGKLDNQIISITGMGGTGKTDLAKIIYKNEVVVHHFDILAWVMIPQEYTVEEILLELVLCLESKRSRESLMSQMSSEEKLGEFLYKSLCGRRYLIIMDDIWDIEVYDQLKLFFPNNRNGSRIMITTRLSNLASQLSNSYSVEVQFLDDDASWNLLCKVVFGEEKCPLELVKIGKRIAKNCNGLPLSIVVIGGLLAKSVRSQQYWEYISDDLNSIVNLEDNQRCLKIFHTSYRKLPVHLKPCFLYMGGVLSKDGTIRVSRLIKLLVGEGFLKPISGKSYEEVAEDYVQELIDRNLILVDSYCYDGKVKVCKMHDLLRDLCLREVEKQKFFCLGFPQERNYARRISIYNKCKWKEQCGPDEFFDALGSARLARSLIWEFEETLPPFSLRLLRVCSIINESFPEAIFQQVNLRYLFLDVECNLLPRHISSSISLIWNLEILVVEVPNGILPSEIWEMPLIRHATFSKAQLPDPPTGDIIVLDNLQTLVEIHNFKCSEEVVKRIPNIKKLKIYYEDFTEEGPRNCISNLGRLSKLESLGVVIDPFPDLEKTQSHLGQNLTFPHSLKKLTIGHTRLPWEELTAKIGSLPLLEVLKLKWKSFIGPNWKTVEGKFSSLKFLLVEFCDDLEYWTTDKTHFPRLEHIVLRDLPLLKGIDSSVGDIPTLGSIELENCTISAVMSAKTLQEEQEDQGNEGLQIRVLLSQNNKALERLANPNFQVKTDVVDVKSQISFPREF